MPQGDTFLEQVDKERERLEKLREQTVAERAAADAKIESIDRELAAIAVYVEAREGKLQLTTTPSKRGRRNNILAIIKSAQNGMTRAELLSHLNGKGDKQVEQMVSNALSALKKARQLTVIDGRYTAS